MSKNKKKELTLKEYIDGIFSGDRTILSKAITLIESQNPKHRKLSQDIIENCLPKAGNSLRIGITGIPGVGKSTFIECFGMYLADKYNKKIAVLAIDPSSQSSKGSILGDKMRMVHLAGNKNAFIRPTPSSGSLGGVARKTHETVILCEASGFDTILIETMGVGQSEYAVNSMVDFFLLLLIAGAGDEIQGIKKGIMEMADAFVINKADGDNKKNAQLAKKELENALKLFPKKESGCTPKVLTCSSLMKEGIEEVWETIEEYKSNTIKNGYFQKKRKEQSKNWMHETIKESLKNYFYKNPSVINNINEIEKSVIEGKMNSFDAANKLLKIYFDNIN